MNEKCLQQGHSFFSSDQDQRAHLLIYSVSLPKREPPSNESRHERIEGPLLAAVDAPLEEHRRLVKRDELGKVEGVLFGGFEDESLRSRGRDSEQRGKAGRRRTGTDRLGLERASMEEKGHLRRATSDTF